LFVGLRAKRSGDRSRERAGSLGNCLLDHFVTGKKWWEDFFGMFQLGRMKKEKTKQAINKWHRSKCYLVPVVGSVV